MKQMKLFDVTEIRTTTLIFTVSFFLTVTGITELHLCHYLRRLILVLIQDFLYLTPALWSTRLLRGEIAFCEGDLRKNGSGKNMEYGQRV